MKTGTKLIILLSILIPMTLQSQNLLIQQIIDDVSADSMLVLIDAMDDMDRVSANLDPEAASFIKAKLEQYDFDRVYFHNWSPIYEPNIVAIKYGLMMPQEYYVVGAHYDDVLISGGADDNASGTAAVLEMARVLDGVHVFKTLMLVLFSGEEMGLLGSEAFADSLCSVEQVKAMFNLDMIAYSAQGLDTNLSVVGDTSGLLQHYLSTAQSYIPYLEVSVDTIIGGGSDHMSFWDHGVPALCLTEDPEIFGQFWNPYFHTFGDTVGPSTNCMILAEMTTKSALAAVLELVGPSLTGIEQVTHTAAMTAIAYPNPANSSITIKLPKSLPGSDVAILIFDQQGRLLRSESLLLDHFNQAHINLVGLSPSLNYFKIVQDQNTYRGSFMVLR